MGRKRRESVLGVYVGSSKVGTYSRAANGSTAFRYGQSWISSERAFFRYSFKISIGESEQSITV